MYTLNATAYRYANGSCTRVPLAIYKDPILKAIEYNLCIQYVIDTIITFTCVSYVYVPISYVYIECIIYYMCIVGIGSSESDVYAYNC